MPTGGTPAAADTLPTGVQRSFGEPGATSGKPVIATYKGKKIDLAKGWAGAQVCTEVTGGAVYCHDNLAEADQALAVVAPAAAARAKNAPAANNCGTVTPQAISDSTHGRACLARARQALGS